MDKDEETAVSEREIVEKYREIAFGSGSRDSDRLRALEWLSAYADRKKGEGAELRRLDEILRSLRPGVGHDTQSDGSGNQDAEERSFSRAAPACPEAPGVIPEADTDD